MISVTDICMDSHSIVPSNPFLGNGFLAADGIPPANRVESMGAHGYRLRTSICQKSCIYSDSYFIKSHL